MGYTSDESQRKDWLKHDDNKASSNVQNKIWNINDKVIDSELISFKSMSQSMNKKALFTTTNKFPYFC